MDAALQLLNKFNESVEQLNEKAALGYQKEILQLELNTASAVTAQYRLGFYLLYKDKKLDEAMSIFKQIANCKIKCADLYQAIISYAICLWSKDKHDQAVFELRKVLALVPENTMDQVLALDYLSLFLKDSKADAKQITEIDNKRIKVLGVIIQNENDPDVQATLKLELAVALEERAQMGDSKQAAIVTKKVVDMGAKIDKITLQTAEKLLKEINKPKPKIK